MNTTSGGAADPAACRHRIRAGIRAARQARGLTQQQAATALEWSLSKMVRIEAGQVRVSLTDLQALLDLYQVSPGQAAALTSTARTARQRPWHAAYPAAAHVPGLGSYLDAETSATAIRGCHVLTVPALFQAPGYGQALLRDTTGTSEHIDLLLARQELLDRPGCPGITWILDEGVLRRCAGGPAVMRDQLRRLAELAAHPRISIRVVPFTAGAYPLAGTTYTIFGLPGQDDDAAVYLDTGDGVLCPPGRDAARYRQHFAGAAAKSADIRTMQLPVAAGRSHPAAQATGAGAAGCPTRPGSWHPG